MLVPERAKEVDLLPTRASRLARVELDEALVEPELIIPGDRGGLGKSGSFKLPLVEGLLPPCSGVPGRELSELALQDVVLHCAAGASEADASIATEDNAFLAGVAKEKAGRSRWNRFTARRKPSSMPHLVREGSKKRQAASMHWRTPSDADRDSIPSTVVLSSKPFASIVSRMSLSG